MNLTLWMAIGVGVGALGGSFFDNIPIGIFIGILGSLAVGSLVHWAGGGKS
jgi:hypothetical protein